MTGTVTGLFTHKSVPVIFEPPCVIASQALLSVLRNYTLHNVADM